VSRPTSSVSSTVQLRLVIGGDLLPVCAELGYSRTDPFAVSVRMGVEGSDRVEWVVARDLLATGLRVPAGEGDVGVWPSRSGGTDVVCLALSSPDGQALLYGPHEAVALFLARTYAAVPPGHEAAYLDLDALVDRLLDRA